MTDTTEMHPVSTSLPDGLWQRFEEERRDEDRNIAQHLRVIVRRYYERLDSEPMRTPVASPRRDYTGPAQRPWPRSSITVGPSDNPHRDDV